ncbi:MAG TPA: PilC/PilY family type IV pilus protein, partial [Rhodocyclaceae bacterium]|nr:PilC/PilY family type IV pilus protein [Rhodocyclaceae bacterium]
TSQPAASATDYATSCAASGVSCSMSSTAASAACASGQRYMVRDKVVATSVVATASCVTNTNSQNPTCPSGASCEWVDMGQGSCSPASKHNFEYRATTTTYTDKGYSLACASSAAAAGTSGYSCSGVCEINASSTSASALSCPSGSAAYNVTKVTPSSTTNLGYSLACYSSAPTAAVGGAGYTAAGTLTIDSSLTSSGALTCPSSYSAYAVTWPATNVSQSLGYTSSCYASAAEASTADYAASCSGSGVSCAIDSGTSTTDSTTACGSGMSRPMVVGSTGSASAATGTYSTASNMYMADEWTRFMHQADLNSAASGTQNVTTYTIDVYNKQQNAEHTALMMSMAMQGGGRYFAAKNQEMILDALKQIVAEIQSVNSTFASASLPVNATNRTQNANQVFIGMFRPDPNAAPRWFGNLKQYQVGLVNGVLDLVDKDGVAATNTQTGFIADCAASFWTSDAYYVDDNDVKRGYWENVIDGATAISPTPKSNCITSGVVGYSDTPDGPTVEKGAVASVIRRGNNPPTTTTTPTWAVNRTVYTRSGSSLTAFTTGSTGLSSNLVDYTLGKDVNVVGSHLSEQTQTQFQAATASNTVRPSVHGDVVHSRPLPINYGSSSSVVVYYGANDGTLRAVDSSTGKELWAFIPPEFNSRLQRLMDNSPLVSYPNLSASITPTPTKKDYFFDGSIGLLQNADNSKVWIYPTQRRGGRMIYGMDVTTPNAPTIKWYQGCETNSTTSDVNCSSGFTGIGQTWSTPVAAYIKGYSTTTPVVIVGGGYDTCEDADTASPSCANPKGAVVYIINADTGESIRSFTTTRSVVADIALADIDGDRYVDYAYVADTGGNIYRINFLAGPDVAGKSTTQALESSEWSLYRVAYTNGGGRKFLFNPGLLPYKGSSVYVAIASGDREHPLETNYPYASVQNRAYVYLDSMSAYNAAPTACDLDSDTCSVDYTTPSTCDSAKVLPGGTPKAWRMALTQYGQGEQAVTSALIAGGMVTFSTNRPIPAASGSCGYALGEARGYWVNLLNASGAVGSSNATCGGDRSATFAGGGLPPSPVLGVVPVDGTPMVVVIGAPPRDGSAASPVKPSRIKPAVSPTRTRKYQYLKVDK